MLGSCWLGDHRFVGSVIVPSGQRGELQCGIDSDFSAALMGDGFGASVVSKLIAVEELKEAIVAVKHDVSAPTGRNPLDGLEDVDRRSCGMK